MFIVPLWTVCYNERMQSTKIPMPGYGLAVIDTTQIEGTQFKGDDRFDTPQSGVLFKLHEDDSTKEFAKGKTFNSLLHKKVWWAKYADADATFYDTTINGDIVFIQLDKLRGYEDG